MEQLVSDCVTLTVTVVSNGIPVELQQRLLKNQLILQQTIIAHCVGRYVQPTEQIQILFQGQNISFGC